MSRTLRISLSLLALAPLGALGCGDDSVNAAVDYGYEYPYVSDVYYPTDVYYSSYYWTDQYAYPDLYYLAVTDTGTVGRADGGAGVVGGRFDAVGNALRAVARGEAVCPGHVNVTPKNAFPACTTDNPTMVRNGVTITFDACSPADGGRIDGMVDVQVTRTASEPACDDSTTITVMHTTVITNLSFTSTDGSKLLIPTGVGTGTNSHMFGQTPTTAQFNLDGRLQTFDAAGALSTDHVGNGMVTVTVSDDHTAYSSDGTLTVQDQRSAARAMLTATGVKRTADCCRPTSGMLAVMRTAGTAPGAHTWVFGPTCGAATFDGNATTLPACN